MAVNGAPSVPNVGTLSLSIQGHVVPSGGAQVSYVLDNVQANGSAETDSTILAAISSLYNPLVDPSRAAAPSDRHGHQL